MCEEEALDGAIEDNDPHMLVGLERDDDLVELRDRFGSENIERWMIECNSPIRRQAPFETDLFGRAVRLVHDDFFQFDLQNALMNLVCLGEAI
jgi:hypothetical protein